MIEITGHNIIATEFDALPKIAQRVVVSSLNRGIKAGESFMVKAVAADMGLSQKAVRKALKTRTATAAHPVAVLGARLNRIPLIEFKARGPKPSRGKGNGVSFTLGGKSRGRIATAFIATMPTGHEGVFTRAGRRSSKNPNREAIDEKFGPSVGHVFHQYRAGGKARAVEAFLSNFDRELDFRKRQAATG